MVTYQEIFSSCQSESQKILPRSFLSLGDTCGTLLYTQQPEKKKYKVTELFFYKVKVNQMRWGRAGVRKARGLGARGKETTGGGGAGNIGVGHSDGKKLR